MALTLMYITNSAEVALIAEKYGVDRVWIDLETLGKELRQKNFDSVKSHHTIDDIKSISPLLTKAEMMVRINPWNEGSTKEIEDVINAGAKRIMLPMWKTKEEVEKFLSAVNSRVHTTLLLETIDAKESLDEVLKLEGIDEIHIGLNDLHIQYGLRFMFELLANGTVDEICGKIKETGIPYGFGGIAKLGYGDVPAELVISEHYRIGSTRGILSRAFCDTGKVTDINEVEKIFCDEMKKLRDYENEAASFTQEDFNNNRKLFIEGVNKVVKSRSGAQANENSYKRNP